jgi:hypothetical protein
MTENKFYIYDVPNVIGPEMDWLTARETYMHDPVGFAEWELRRAKLWANLIATDFDKVQEMQYKPMNHEKRHENAVNTVKACEQRLNRARLREAKKKKPAKKGKIDKSSMV